MYVKHGVNIELGKTPVMHNDDPVYWFDKNELTRLFFGIGTKIIY